MPELPEVQTLVDDLNDAEVCGAVIKAAPVCRVCVAERQLNVWSSDNAAPIFVRDVKLFKETDSKSLSNIISRSKVQECPIFRHFPSTDNKKVTKGYKQ